MSNKGLIDVIEGMLSEGANDTVNQITAANKDKKQKEHGSSPDTQGVLGKTSGAALDAGGDKDVGDHNKGKIASDASPDTQGVEGKTKGAAIDAGGDKDVGKINGKTALPSGASSKVEADKGPHSLASDKGLGEETEGKCCDDCGTDKCECDKDVKEEKAFEWLDALTEEEQEDYFQSEEFEALDEVSKGKLRDYHQAAAKSHNTARVTGDKETMGKRHKGMMTAVKKQSKATDDSIERDGGKADRAKVYASEEKKMDAVDKDELKGDHKDRKDKDIDNDGDADKSDEYLHKKRKAISKAMKEDFDIVNEDTQEAMTEEEIETLVAEMTEEELLEAEVELGLTEAEGETLKKVSGEENAKYRPDAEKGKNEPKAKEGKVDQGPHDQGKDPIETSTKANPKGSVSEEADDLEEEFIELEDFMTVMEMTEEEVEALSEEDLEKMKADYAAKGGKVTKLKPGTAKGTEYGYKQGQMKNAMRSKGSKGILKGRSDGIKEDSLDEDFKARAEVIFETAVNEKTSIIREEMEAEFETKLTEAKAELNEQVGSYVEEAIAEWMAENALEIKYSLRTEIAENFMKGLKGLFEDSYIEIPEEDYSVVDELTEAVETYKEQLEEQTAILSEAKAEVLAMKRSSILEAASEDLTETQKIKLESLADHVEAQDIKEFEYKINELKEGYFDPKAEQPMIGTLAEEVFHGTQEEIMENVDPTVASYASYLGKTAR